MSGRYRFYREHKYISMMAARLEKLAGTADFRSVKEVSGLKEELTSFSEMLKGHARHEDNKIHHLLFSKEPQSFHKFFQEHEKHLANLDALQTFFSELEPSSDDWEKIYLFNMKLRKFLVEDFQHRLEEEHEVMPLLHKHYTDEELKTIEHEVYREMTVDQLDSMLEHLWPCFNPDDKRAFLDDIREAVPVNFSKLRFQGRD